jgi:hypothetical protein
MGLVEAGALGGVVSLTDLPNSLATRVGRDLARLFDAGFPLYAALDVVGTGPFAESAYSIAGDPMVQLCQCATGSAVLAEVEINGSQKFAVESQVYPTNRFSVGSMVNLQVHKNTIQYIASGEVSNKLLNNDEMDQLFTLGKTPVRVENSIYWTDECDWRSVFPITGRQ